MRKRLFLILYFNMPYLGSKILSLRKNRNEDKKDSFRYAGTESNHKVLINAGPLVGPRKLENIKDLWENLFT